MKPARHHQLIISKVEALIRGEGPDRLLILAPPGSAKSTYVSGLLAPWYLANFPDHTVIAASHTASLAARWGRTVRNTIGEYVGKLGITVSRDKSAANEWTLKSGGEYFAAGVLGPITGRRADLVILDDIVKSRKEADSETVRNSVWEWFTTDLTTRLKPNGKIVLIMTHWHEDDIAGRIQREMADGGDQWEILRLPALAELNDPLGRAEGEALWPEWEDRAKLLRKKKTMGDRNWNALFQQRPSAMEGTIILRKWWKKWSEEVPRPEFIVISLDTAYTEKEENDRSACGVWYVVNGTDTTRQKILLRYAWAEHLQFNDLVTRVIETVEHFGMPRVPMRLLIESKASGLSVIQELRRRVPGISIWPIVPAGDKVARAYAVQTIFENGSVYAMAKKEVVREADSIYINGETVNVSEIEDTVFRPWASDVIDECSSFPLGRFKDQVDQTTQALRHIREMGVELFSEDEPEPEPISVGYSSPTLY